MCLRSGWDQIPTKVLYHRRRGFSLHLTFSYLVGKSQKFKQLLPAPSLQRNIPQRFDDLMLILWNIKNEQFLRGHFFSYERGKVAVAQTLSSFRLINTNRRSRTLTTHLSS